MKKLVEPRRFHDTSSLGTLLAGSARRDSSTGCAIWNGPFNGQGAPALGNKLARNVAYHLGHRELQVCPRLENACGNRLCVLPSHQRPYFDYKIESITAILGRCIPSTLGCMEWRSPGLNVVRRRVCIESGHTLPKGRCVKTSCKNPLCIAPGHLRPLDLKRPCTLDDIFAQCQRQGPRDCMVFGGVISGSHGSVLHRGKRVMAHRLAYALAHGLDYSTLGVIKQTCRNPMCCNISHMQTSGAPLRLSADLVQQMKTDLSDGLSTKAIASKYAVILST